MMETQRPYLARHWALLLPVSTGRSLWILSAVVSIMASVAHFTNFKNSNTSNSKIPEYAKDFRKEWLYIRGINKKCGEFSKKLNNTTEHEEVFWSFKPKALIKDFKNVLEAQKVGKFQNISKLKFKYFDVNNIEILEEQLDNYRDLYVDPDSYEFDEESYDLNIDIDFPGFRELFKLICLFNDKIKKEEPIINWISESDDSDYFKTNNILLDSESDSDSDSDF